MVLSSRSGRIYPKEVWNKAWMQYALSQDPLNLNAPSSSKHPLIKPESIFEDGQGNLRGSVSMRLPSACGKTTVHQLE
jgi:hypothetical protein